jgi:Tfp pilus assembly protein PilO
MMKGSPLLEVVKRPIILLVAGVLVVVVIVWMFAFFIPQSHKLSSLDEEKAALQQQVVQDNARLQQVRTESHHVGQIQTIDTRLKGYVPETEDLYTYIQTLSSAAKSTGVTITSLQPSSQVAATGTSYSAVPITAEVKSSYDHLVAFINAIYGLPRLTDINSLDITGGGPGTNRSAMLNVTVNLVIFSSQKASTP